MGSGCAAVSVVKGAITVSLIWGSPGGSVVKNPPASTGDGVGSLGREDPIKKEMATRSSILA